MDDSNARRVLEDFRLHADGLLENFTGRKWLVKRIRAWQKDARAKPFLLLQGAAGIGKSAFAAHLWRQREMLTAIHFCIAGRGGTTDPLTFVETLSAQLAAAVPGFDQARRQIWEAYSRHSTNIQSQVSTGDVHPGGQVTGVSVRLTLASIDPKQAFDLLVRRPLQALSQVGQLHPTLILVDALDEAIYGHPTRPNILDLLLDAQDFPPEVRWMLTSRAEPQVTEPLHALPVEVLDASLPEHRDDIRAYIRRRMGELETTARLWRVEVEALPELLGEKVEWNFLYLTTVWPELAAGRFASPDDLPASLNAYYRSLLNRQIPSDAWDNWGADLMEVLLALREPVDAETLAAFLGWKPRPTLQRLNRLAPLLSPALLREGRYYRHHWSLVEALRDREQAGNWFCDLPEGHRRIAEHFLTVWGGLDAGLPLLRNIERPDYGTRHLVTHLLESEQTERVFQLLRLAWEVAGKPVPACFIAHERIGTPDEFARDLRQAWQAASQINRSDALQGRPCSRLGEEIRCALIEASMHSLAANLSPELPALLVQHSYWRARQALAYIRQMPDEGQRAEALEHLAPHLPPDLLPEALAAAREIQDADDRARALTALAERLPEVLPEALAAAREIQDADDRARALTALAKRLPEVLPEALAAAREIWYADARARARALTALFPHLPPELLPEALAAAREIQHEYARAGALTALAERFPEVFPEALAAARKIWDADARARALTALAERFPEVFPAALAAAREIQYANARARALTALAERLPPELLPEALAAAREIQDADARADALTALAERLPPDLLPAALAAAREIQDAKYRAYALAALAEHLPPELLPEALAAAREIQHEYARAGALTALAERFPEVFPEALAAARKIWDADARARALTAPTERLTTLPRAQAYPLWAEILPVLARRTRPDLLFDLGALAPLIHALGGEQAIGETFLAVQDVAKWWP